MSKKASANNADQTTRLIDLLERLGAVALYLGTDMGHHQIARRLGMGTQRVTQILKGVKKPKMPNPRTDG